MIFSKSVNTNFITIVSWVFYLIVISNSCLEVSAQELPKIIHRSPNSSSFAKYGDIPVNNYTGVPNISIPIYTIKSGDIEVPLTLSYHAGGIQVAQEASWVGLGWSLSQGGSITRNVRGIDDFCEDLACYSSGHPNEGNLPKIEPGDIGADQFNFSSVKQSQYFNIVTEYTDPAPDAFHYNILGYSGTFILPKNNGLSGVSVMQNGLKFEYNQSQKKWLVTDGNGWEYHIDITEKTLTTSALQTKCPDNEGGYTPCNSTTTHPEVITSWHLSKILTPKGDQVTFDYKGGFGSKTESRETIIVPVGIDVKNHLAGDSSSYHPYGYNPHKITSSISSVEEKYIDKITFKTGYVQFNREDRTDLDLHQKTSYKLNT